MNLKNELMLGNWVIFNNRYFQIASISDEYPFLNTTEFGVGIVEWDWIFPIKLTDEILKKLKFYRHMNYDFDWVKCDFKICYDPDNENYYLQEKENAEITYLHELQNMYLLLMKEPLKCDGIF